MLPPSRELSELGPPLRREHLHVFVADPGRGEGIAIALPARGWVVIDSCRAATGASVPFEIVERWRSPDDDPVLWAILSHPHEDHADGFAEIVDGLSPKHIGIAGARSLPRYIDILRDAELPRRTEDRRRASQVATALRAIRSWEELHGPATPLCDATTPLAEVTPSMYVRAPSADALHGYLERCVEEPRYLRPDANQYSLVLDVQLTGTRLVLPGDLPTTVGGQTIPTGWTHVMGRHPSLGQHALLKIPHHGSAEAHHEDLMPSATEARAWPVTPYNSARLPRLAETDGLPALLAKNGSVQLTGLPVAKARQFTTPSPGVASLAELRDRISARPTGSPFLDRGGIEITPRDALDPLDAIWCFAIDAAGTIVARYRGAIALDIVP